MFTLAPINGPSGIGIPDDFPNIFQREKVIIGQLMLELTAPRSAFVRAPTSERGNKIFRVFTPFVLKIARNVCRTRDASLPGNQELK